MVRQRDSLQGFLARVAYAFQDSTWYRPCVIDILRVIIYFSLLLRAAVATAAAPAAAATDDYYWS